jgi:hypothetical protein
VKVFPRFASAVALVALSACAPVEQASPTRYAALPAASTQLVFEAEANVFPITPQCRPAELPGENGIDDDCDGRIDRPREPRPALTLATAHTSPGALSLTLVPEAGACPVRAQTEEATQGEALGVIRIDLRALACGRYALVLRRRGEPPLPFPSAITLSVETPTGTRTYLTQGGPESVRTLGYIEAR